MFRRLCRHLLLVMAFAIVGMAPVAGTPARIIAIGDLHGDFDAWRQIALASGLMDAKGHWAGGTAAFVQTGDVPDRGADTLKIITDLQRLEKEAPRAGGSVFALIGNHEAMNIIGDLRYVSPGEYAVFATPNSENLRDQYFQSNRRSIAEAYGHEADTKLTNLQIRENWYAAHPLGRIEHQIAWGPKGKIGKWIVGHSAVLKLGDTLFVHGGISPAYVGKAIDAINSGVKKALVAQDVGPDAIINDPDGPLWYRGLARETAATDAAGAAFSVGAELEALFQAFGANRIVIGHSPQLAGILQRQDGRLILIDTGISASFGGKLGWLEISNGKVIPHEIARAPRVAKGASSP